MADAIVARAAEFIWQQARLLERRRFHYLFGGGGRDEVLAVLYAYQNPDGGFGNALVPDLRIPASHPIAAEMALRVLAELGGNALIIFRLCSYLERIAQESGAVMAVQESGNAFGAAPWVIESEAGDLYPTGALVGWLYVNGARHTWLERATAFCWRALEGGLSGPESFLAALRFLNYVPDRERAQRAVQKIGEQLFACGAVTLQVSSRGNGHGPLEYAPHPASVARTLFTEEVIAQHLDALEARQEVDGGWPIWWEPVSKASELEWRGWLTLEALVTLRAYGRL